VYPEHQFHSGGCVCRRGGEHTDELVDLYDVFIVISFQISATAIEISDAAVSPAPGVVS
jgi:hypothetical protein